ncbi:MAG TPA: hypothetical protein VN025_11655 [Candidatus Dormibacteraeota bacterium]|jgi:hypothetical protein|nr:hypothetical protein [Candidatus Dormibacteraeota bacterium]
MVSLFALWLPILLAAVIVFIASSIIHMVLPYHKSSYRKLSDEDKVRAAIRASNPSPGLYNLPFCTQKDLNSPETKAKFTEGPVGHLIILPNGPVFLPKFLVQWFVFCLVVGIFVAYLTGHTLSPGTHYRPVFRVAGTAAFLAYGVGGLSNGVWKGYPWKMVLLEAFDGLIYGLLTAGTFGWLWPR